MKFWPGVCNLCSEDGIADGNQSKVDDAGICFTGKVYVSRVARDNYRLAEEHCFSRPSPKSFGAVKRNETVAGINQPSHGSGIQHFIEDNNSRVVLGHFREESLIVVGTQDVLPLSFTMRCAPSRFSFEQAFLNASMTAQGFFRLTNELKSKPKRNRGPRPGVPRLSAVTNYCCDSTV